MTICKLYLINKVYILKLKFKNCRASPNVEKQLADNSFSATEDEGYGETLFDIENDKDTSLEPTKISTDLPSSYGKKRIRSKEDKISQILTKRSKERDIILSKILRYFKIIIFKTEKPKTLTFINSKDFAEFLRPL